MCCTWVEMHSMVFMVFPRCYCCIPLSHLLYLLYTLNHHKSFLSLGNFPLSFSWLYSSISIHSSNKFTSLQKTKESNKFFSDNLLSLFGPKNWECFGFVCCKFNFCFLEKFTKFLHKIENKNHDISVCYVCSRNYVLFKKFMVLVKHS